MHWKALGGTLNRLSIHTALKAALDTKAEQDKRINNLKNIYKTILLLMKFPTSELMIWQILIHGKMQELRSIPSAPLPRASSSGFDLMDDINDQSDSK